MEPGRQNQSDIARILNQIEAEYVAARRGLTGLAESARHAAITARMKRMGQFRQSLHAIVGDNAIRLIVERLEAIQN
ncbi:MAG TPA: hypothetical protein VFV38_24970 [Ktedonobacteraceae bacterium]|nr:hypothetical protein [Ktedonobacteraceae bacterium]